MTIFELFDKALITVAYISGNKWNKIIGNFLPFNNPSVIYLTQIYLVKLIHIIITYNQCSSLWHMIWPGSRLAIKHRLSYWLNLLMCTITGFIVLMKFPITVIDDVNLSWYSRNVFHASTSVENGLPSRKLTFINSISFKTEFLLIEF